MYVLSKPVSSHPVDVPLRLSLSIATPYTVTPPAHTLPSATLPDLLVPQCHPTRPHVLMSGLCPTFPGLNLLALLALLLSYPPLRLASSLYKLLVPSIALSCTTHFVIIGLHKT